MGNVWWLTPETFADVGLGSPPLVEEIASGLRAVSTGSRKPRCRRLRRGRELRFILAAGLGNAWQPIVGQYLNLDETLIAGQRHQLCGTDLSGAAD